jgi:hypothetical protein
MLRALAAAVILLTLPAPLRAEWVRVESSNFVLYGEIGERRTRDYAREFERFREALGRAVPGATPRTAVPTIVYLFENARSMASYRPLYNGKPVELTGYFVSDGAISTIMIAASEREQALRTIFHEYSHLVTSQTTRALPTWVEEGLAEYYSTFQVGADGRSALMGGLIEPHRLLLHSERLLPLEQLLAVHQDSPLYNEGSRRSMFYAQSWALVHLLMNGDPDRRKPFALYRQRTASGESATEAWRALFGEMNVVRELERYIRQTTMKGYRFAFDTEVNDTGFSVTKPTAAEVHGALAELRRLTTPDRALSHVEATPGGSSLYGDVVRALFLIDRGQQEDALALLMRTAEAADDWLVKYRAAVALERIATASDTEASRTAAAAAIDALTSVLAARPELPHALAIRGLLLGSTDEGIASIARARELAPGNEHYATYHAQLLIHRGAVTEARKILGPLMSPIYPPEFREHVRALLTASVAAEKARTAAGSLAVPAGGAGQRPDRGSIVYVFRQLQPGEQRIEGILERIDCPRTGQVLRVRAAGRQLTFTLAAIDDVEFIAYTSGQSGTVGCGPRPPNERVYVTYRAAAKPGDADGVAVAVEFLPADAR